MVQREINLSQHYYNKTEIDNKLINKSDVTHNHDDVYLKEEASVAIYDYIDDIISELNEQLNDD